MSLLHLVSTSQSKEFIGFCFEWINELSTDQTLNHYNFATTKGIVNQRKLAWSPECIDSVNMKIICSKHDWDLHVVNFACSTVIKANLLDSLWPLVCIIKTHLLDSLWPFSYIIKAHLFCSFWPLTKAFLCAIVHFLTQSKIVFYSIVAWNDKYFKHCFVQLRARPSAVLCIWVIQSNIRP